MARPGKTERTAEAIRTISENAEYNEEEEKVQGTVWVGTTRQAGTTWDRVARQGSTVRDRTTRIAKTEKEGPEG